MLDDINAVVVFSTKQFKDDEFGGTFTVPPGGVLEKIAKSNDIPKELLQKINGITDPRRLRAGQNLKIIKGPFNAVVDKSDFSLELWIGEPGAKGSMYVTTLPVGLGTDDSTPTGVWAVQNRVPNPTYFSPRGGGIIPADDPKNPLGERWIGLTGTDGAAVGKTSYGIHGTIDPDSIGKQASMGCIRLKNEDVTKVYDALVEGKSTVTVRD
jgi:lipoprotein-anchoring transpeptidase ErfK/SrfK